MKRFLRRGLCFVLLAGCITAGMTMLMTVFIQRSSKPYWINRFRDRSFDFVVMGDSRAKRCIDVGEVNDALSVSGLNLGMDLSNAYIDYALFDAFIRKNHVKKLFYQVDFYSVAEPPDSLRAEQFFNLLPALTSRSMLFQNLSDLRRCFVRCKGLAYLYHNDVFMKKCIHGLTGRKEFDRYGTYIIDKAYHYDERHCFPVQIRNFRNHYLIKLDSLARHEKIEIIYFTMPYTQKRLDKITGLAAFEDHMQHQGAHYFNFIHSVTETRYYYDDEHLNREGVQRFTGQFINTLKKHQIFKTK